MTSLPGNVVLSNGTLKLSLDRLFGQAALLLVGLLPWIIVLSPRVMVRRSFWTERQTHERCEIGLSDIPQS